MLVLELLEVGLWLDRIAVQTAEPVSDEMLVLLRHGLGCLRPKPSRDQVQVDLGTMVLYGRSSINEAQVTDNNVATEMKVSATEPAETLTS